MRRRVVTGIAAGAVVVAALGGAAWAATSSLGARPAPTRSAAVPLLTGLASPMAEVPTRTATPTPTPSVARTCSVGAAASDPRLHSFQGQVVNARTGEVLFSRRAGTASRAGSVMKVLTSAAALKVLGPDYRLTTKVVAGAKKGQVVLVGGGDVTLTRTTSGTTVYAGAPHLSTLAKRVKVAWAKRHGDEAITSVVLDSSYFGGPAWQPSWDTVERSDGTTPNMTALMVDGDRDDPFERQSRRSTDPVGRAGEAFAALLGSDVAVSRGTAPKGAATLGEVHSQPVSTLIGQALQYSDNTIAEALARVTTIVAGDGDRFTDEQDAVVGALKSYGVDTAKLRVVDGSGLSNDDAIPPEYLTQLMRQVRTRSHGLGPIYDGLPVAGRPGSLGYSDRFQGAAARADGQVRAKTGWIDTGYTLAGIIHAKDGTPLTFAYYALGPVTESTKYALDGLTADTWSCGAKLSNH